MRKICVCVYVSMVLCACTSVHARVICRTRKIEGKRSKMGDEREDLGLGLDGGAGVGVGGGV